MQQRTEQWLFVGVVIVVIGVLGVIAWLRQSAPQEEALPASEPPAQTEAAPASADAEREATPEAEAPAEPLPALADSDPEIRLSLSSLFGPSLENVLAREAVIEKIVTTIDNLPREKLAERLRPVDKVPGTFATTGPDNQDHYGIAKENDRRYDALVAMFTNTPTSELVGLYRRYYPLLQEAYVGLGYPDGSFDTRLKEVIDHLLATPEPAQSPDLVRPHVLYRYADADLEAESSGRKILLRMGSDNRAAVKSRLRELRAALDAPAITG